MIKNQKEKMFLLGIVGLHFGSEKKLRKKAIKINKILETIDKNF